MKTGSTIDESLERFQRQLGFSPNLFKEMGQSPAVLEVYLKGQEALSKGSLTAKEQQIVQRTVAVYNDCHDCKTAHQWQGQKMGVSSEEIQKIRSGVSPSPTPHSPISFVPPN